MKTRLLILLLSVVLVVGCLPLSSYAVDVYHLMDDTTPPDMGTSTVAADPDTAAEPVLFQSLAAASPYSTSTATYWSSTDISNALKYLQNISSYTSKLGDTNTWLKAINTQNGNTLTHLTTIERYLENVNKFVGAGVNPWWTSLNGGIINLQNDIKAVTASVNGISTGPLVEQLTAIQKGMGFPEKSSFYQSGTAPSSWYDNKGYALYRGGAGGRNLTNASWYQVVNYILASLVTPNPNGDYACLGSNGLVWKKSSELLLVDAVAQGNLGLASILRGRSGNYIGGSILTNGYFEFGEQPVTLNTDNILDSLFPLYPIQNDLARLTYVLADPHTIDLKKSQQGNEQAVQDNFTGDKGVNPDDIGSMSGMGDSLGGLVDTGVTMDDGFAQLNNGDTWNFFSQEVANQLNNAPAAYARDEDFVHFYDPDNTAFQELLEQVRGGE